MTISSKSYFYAQKVKLNSNIFCWNKYITFLCYLIIM